VRESNRRVISMVNPTASTADAGPAFAAAFEASVGGPRTVMPASASAVYPTTSVWESGGASRPVAGSSRPPVVSRPSVASSLHGSFTTRHPELSCASSIVAPLPTAAASPADSDVKVTPQSQCQGQSQRRLGQPTQTRSDDVPIHLQFKTK